VNDRSSSILAAVADLFISFLPFAVVYVLLIAFSQNQPRPDLSFLVATLFTEGAWKARLIATERPTERWSAVLIGVGGATVTTVAAILLLLVELNVLQPQHNLGVRTFALWVSFWGYLVAIPYALFVRYKAP
jgi:hypothetical protein